MVEAALEYVRGQVFGRPVSVFPVAEGDKRPLTANGFKAASSDEVQILEWWSKRPNANIGLPLEANGLCAIDIDGDKGFAAWAGLDGSRFPASLTCISMTPRGSHLIYAVPAGRKPRGTVGVFPSVDLRGPGYVIAPPSVHENGTTYRWVMPPSHLEPQPAPEWILQPLEPEHPVPVPEYKQIEGHTPYGYVTLMSLAEEMASAQPGTRNDALIRKALRVLDLVATRDIDHDNAWYVLRLAAAEAGLPEREIEATLASAIRSHRGY